MSDTDNGSAALAPVLETQIEKRFTADDVADLKAQIALLDQVRRAVIAITSPSQWVDFGGKPYLQGDGALTIASLFGLEFDEPEFEWRDLAGGATQCICRQTARHRTSNRMFSDQGDCDSFDSFLIRRKKELGAEGATDEQITEICRVEMEKKARANAISRVVSGWTGIRGLSWEDLQRHGLGRDAVQEQGGNVTFQHGRHSTKPTSQQPRSGGPQKPNYTPPPRQSRPAEKPVPDKCELKTIAEIQAAPHDSWAALHGFTKSISDFGATPAGRTFLKVDVGDETGEMQITLWTDVKPECLEVVGAGVFFPKVTVKVKGKYRNYWAGEVQGTDAPQPQEDDDEQRPSDLF